MKDIRRIKYAKVDNKYVDFKIKTKYTNNNILFSFWDNDKKIDGGCIINTSDESYTVESLFLNEKEILSKSDMDDYGCNVQYVFFIDADITIEVVLITEDDEELTIIFEPKISINENLI